MLMVENMQHVTDGGPPERKLERLPLENGDCSSPVVLPKYKRRKVSAVRDFPPGCGRLAPQNPGPMEPAASVVFFNKVDGFELLNVKPTGIDLPTTLDDAGLIDPLKAVEHETSEFSNDSLKADSAAPAEDMAKSSCLKLESPPDSPEKTVTRKYPPRRRISATRDFPPFCGRNAPCLSKEECLRTPASSMSNSLGPEKYGVEDKLLKETIRTDVKQIGDNVQDEDNIERKFKAAVSKNSRDKVQAESEVVGTKDASKQVKSETFSEIRMDREDTRKQSFRPPRENDLNRPEHKSWTGIKEVEMEVGGLEEKVGRETVVCNREMGGLEGKAQKEIVVHKGKMGGLEGGKVGKEIVVYSAEVGGLEREVGKEIVVYSGEVGGLDGKVGREFEVHMRDKSLKRKFSSSSVSEDQIQTEDVGLKLSMDRVIVQGLMAAPNCPWRQAKWAFKPKSADGLQRSKVKKHDLSGKEKTKSIFREKKVSAENLGGNSMKKKSPSMGKASYHGTYEMVVRDEVNSFEHDEALEDFHVAHRSHDFNVSLPPLGPSSSSGKGDDHDAIVTRNKVRETLRLFQAVCRKLLQEEEAKSKAGGHALKRVDLQAAKILKDKGKYVNTGKQIVGDVPGVQVGDEFHYRVELAIIGLHRLFQAGIDYLKLGRKGKVIATSVVASGGYADDLDNSDVLIYTGSGGNIVAGDKQPEDQKLERGNLALKNSMEAKNPVRVIRGFKETRASDSSDTRGKTVATYTYDGLYWVEKCWQELGPHGKLVFKFQLVRILGQPELAWNEVKRSKKFKIRDGLCVNDIAEGREKIPICAVNTVDFEKPPPFRYINRMIYPDWYCPIPLKGCDCTGGCSDSEKCYCAVRNGGEIPFNYNGAIVEAKPLVYECGPSCKCLPSCHNRVSQHGIKFQLEIFKTQSRGWGVRSLNSIPSGSFICEYIGELLEDKEAEQRTGNDEYLFDIGQNYNDHTLWDGLSNLMPDAQSSSCEVVEDVGFTIDAAESGNVGRFINHSCSPNLYAQNVLYDHEDKRMPHIMFFAAENIPPLQELTYHYNYMIDQVRDSDGNIKKKSCYCGSPECTGRMY